MNLLLLLSALLSALTGVVTGGRVSEMPQAVCRAAHTETVRPVFVAKIAARPTQAIASLIDVAHAALPTSDDLVPIVPAYASRRRE